MDRNAARAGFPAIQGKGAAEILDIPPPPPPVAAREGMLAKGQAKGKDKAKGKDQSKGKGRPDMFTSASYRDWYDDWYACRSNHGPE